MIIPVVSQHGLASLLFPTCTVMCLVLGALCAATRVLLPEVWQKATSKGVQRAAQIGLLLPFLFLYLGSAYYALTFPGYIDPVEPLVVAASYFALHGRPVYDMVLTYGPYCFLIYGFAIKLLGASITTIKLVVAAGNVAFAAILLLLYRKMLNCRAAFLTVSLVLAACLMKLSYLVQARGDLFIYIAAALGLLSALTPKRSLAMGLMVAALTLACGIKITALLYLLYPMVLLVRRHGYMALGACCGLALFLSALPFAMHTFAFHDYWHWLVAFSKHPRSRKEFVGNIVTTCLIASPCVVAFYRLRLRDHVEAARYLRSEWFPLLSLLFGVLMTDVVASKIGAGRHHLLPFLPTAALISIQISQRKSKVSNTEGNSSFWPIYLYGCIGLILFITALSEFYDLRLLTTSETPQAIAMQEDIRQILSTHQGQSVELGDGIGEFDLETVYSPMYSAPQLVFAGNAYTYEPSAEADANMIDGAMRDSDERHVRFCETKVFLIPRGDKPFHSFSIYSGMYPELYGGRLLFSKQFEQTFSQVYQQTSSSKFYDIYTCRHS